jgi:anthranilate synthase component 2
MSRPAVLVIDNYDSFTHNLTQLIEECGWAPHVVKNDRLDRDEVRRYGNVIISPGPGVPSEAGMLCDFIRRFSREKSILGICLGHQAIAEVFGGRLVQLPHPLHGIKQKVTLKKEGDVIFAGLPTEFDVGLYHSWAVSSDNLPTELHVTATSDDGTVMALAHHAYDVRGIQFHPESVMTAHGKTIIGNWLGGTTPRR